MPHQLPYEQRLPYSVLSKLRLSGARREPDGHFACIEARMGDEKDEAEGELNLLILT